MKLDSDTVAFLAFIGLAALLLGGLMLAAAVDAANNLEQRKACFEHYTKIGVEQRCD